jgi:hypothetical protein
MPRPKIVERWPIEILFDNRRAYVGRACNRSVFPSFSPTAHMTPETTRLALASLFAGPCSASAIAARSVPPPRPEILGSEFLAHVLGDVLIQQRAGELVGRPFAPIAEQASPAGNLKELLHRVGEVVADDRRPNRCAVLSSVAERDLAPADGRELRVVQVLATTGAVDSRRLELRFRPRPDPHVSPGGWNGSASIRATFSSSVMRFPRAS